MSLFHLPERNIFKFSIIENGKMRAICSKLMTMTQKRNLDHVSDQL